MNCFYVAFLYSSLTPLLLLHFLLSYSCFSFSVILLLLFIIFMLPLLFPFATTSLTSSSLPHLLSSLSTLSYLSSSFLHLLLFHSLSSPSSPPVTWHLSTSHVFRHGLHCTPLTPKITQEDSGVCYVLIISTWRPPFVLLLFTPRTKGGAVLQSLRFP